MVKMATTSPSIDQLTINTIRTLAMDAVEAASSGHPGTPMALAPVAYRLWQDRLRFDPDWPNWPARDRFVLSCGHASMLLYAVLHLAQVRQLDDGGQPTGELAVPLEHIRNFRQWESRCPGHPEHELTSGVETTTGPLGQGVANSVGMSIAQRWLSARFDRPDFPLFDYNVYALASDGDLMEGVGSEAASLAGHLHLGNLCWLYDDNRITIDGGTSLAFSEDVGARFRGYGWHVAYVSDANDLEQLDDALEEFDQTDDRPTLIIVRSHIGWGAPNKQDTSAAHGSPLGAGEVRSTKAVYGWPEDSEFLVPPEAREHFYSAVSSRGGAQHEQWRQRFDEYAREYPQQAAEWKQLSSGELPKGWDADLPVFPADPKGEATRNSGGKTLNAIAPHVPWLLGGAADLASSTKTTLKFDGAGDFSDDNPSGRNFHFGVREHAMAAIVNGMTLSGLRAYGSTFLVFSDYCRPSLRLAALMHLPSIFVFTHDSIGVGEDGPTHQPVEHVASLRAMPNMLLIRPGDANEASEAWRVTLESRHRPVSMVLTRQNLPTLDREKYAPASGVRQGAYILADPPEGQSPQVLLLASGSELNLAVAAYEQLAEQGIAARVVSMPCWELFEDQPAEYRQQVLPPDVTARVVIEAGVSFGWERYLGTEGRAITVETFGASAPYQVVYEKYGLTIKNLIQTARELVKNP